MSTKSNRSSGTQINSRGITQGNTLVGPSSGLPFDEILDTNGKRRLAVDASLTLDSVTVNIDDLTPDKDQVSIGDHTSGNSLLIEPDGSLNANVKVDAADGDNIAISDGVHTLHVNPDGSINVSVAASNSGTVKSIYNEVTSVASTILTSIVTYTAPIGKISYLQLVSASGTNIAEYTITINGSNVAKQRTYFGNSLNTEFIYAVSGLGLPLVVGDIVVVKVIHTRPTLADFEARIQVEEV